MYIKDNPSTNNSSSIRKNNEKNCIKYSSGDHINTQFMNKLQIDHLLIEIENKIGNNQISLLRANIALNLLLVDIEKCKDFTVPRGINEIHESLKKLTLFWEITIAIELLKQYMRSHNFELSILPEV